MKYTHFLITLFLSALLAFFALAQTHIHEHSKRQTKSDTLIVKEVHQKMAKEKYTCTMHPEVISDMPGKCPKCGMKLVKMKPILNIKKPHTMHNDTSQSHPKKIY